MQKNKPLNEIEEEFKQEEVEQKIQKKLTVLEIKDETIYGTIKFESTIENLEYIITPENNQIKLEKETRQLAIDYELQNRQEYEFKVKVKGNEEEIIIIVVDKELLPQIQIEQDNYAHIKAQGVILERTITMDKTEGYRTIYSLDNGKNWEEYTQQIKINQLTNAVIAQKVPINETNSLITIERYVKMPVLAEDAIGIPAYDYNEETIEIINEGKYIKIEEQMEGFKIQILGNAVVTFVQEDKNTLIKQKSNGNKYIVPKKARYVKINGYVNEIRVIPSVKFDETKQVIGQTKITVGAITNGYSQVVTYEYFLDGVLKFRTMQNTYQYVGLSPFATYTIEIRAIDESGNIDSISQKITTKADNTSIVGFITSDRVDKSNSQQLQPTQIAKIQYTYDVLYLNQSNIKNYGYYEADTKTYVITKDVKVGSGSELFGKMAVLKCDENLRIENNVTITTATYAETVKQGEKWSTTGDVTKLKGLFICCMGKLTNNGTISQTARGTYTNGITEDVYLWADISKGDSEKYKGYIVPGKGADGGYNEYQSGNNLNGAPGKDGIDRKTGGGGAGGAYTKQSGFRQYGDGSSGTAYAGGSGGGGMTMGNGGRIYGNNGNPGGAGGNGVVVNATNAGAGTGVISGVPKGSEGSFGNFGTGGLLIIYANYLENVGNIQANGVDARGSEGSPGGASGGGSINIFYTSGYSGKYPSAQGGSSGNSYNKNNISGRGGNGSITYSKIEL